MINEYGELVEILYSNKIKIERITSNSNITDYMKEDLNEFVYLLEGEAKLELDKKLIILNKGNYLVIPKNTEHRVIYTSEDCKWLCIFFEED